MEVGIVSMHPTVSEYRTIVPALQRIGYSSIILYREKMTDDELLHAISTSKIQHWIFTGSHYNVNEENAPYVPLDILKIPKYFLLICYSIESFITQLLSDPTLLKKRYEKKSELFHLKQPTMYSWLFNTIKEKMVLRRSHRYYLSSGTIAPITEIAAYRGEVMIATYKNCLLTQFQPDKTPDGVKMIKNWLDLPLTHL